MSESAIPAGLRYSRTHEWLLSEDGRGTVGITDFAQDELGDIVFLELPEPGTQLTQDEPFGVVESVKAAVDLVSPVSGEVLTRNEALLLHPELVNASPYGEGWMMTLRLGDESELERLLDAAAYREWTGTG